jgi:hypothetical protein
MAALIISAPAACRTSGKPAESGASAPPQAVVLSDAERRFQEMLADVRLVGAFTTDGKEGEPPQQEEYGIQKVEKRAKGDAWVFHVRFKLAGREVTLPLVLEVRWAGDTPMITLTNLTILGQGPFSARVLFAEGRYAGTWSHGPVGGHLFGKIVKVEPKRP